jgi:hypothetical protein
MTNRLLLFFSTPLRSWLVAVVTCVCSLRWQGKNGYCLWKWRIYPLTFHVRFVPWKETRLLRWSALNFSHFPEFHVAEDFRPHTMLWGRIVSFRALMKNVNKKGVENLMFCQQCRICMATDVAHTHTHMCRGFLDCGVFCSCHIRTVEHILRQFTPAKCGVVGGCNHD